MNPSNLREEASSPKNPSTHPDAVSSEISPSVRVLLSVFIISHLVMIGIWSLPPGPLRQKLLIRPISSYLLRVGLAQRWDMFVPPRFETYHFEAEITFADGSQKVWEFPRIDRFPVLERFAKERYAEWVFKLFASFQGYLPDTARYIARLHASPSNPPKKITIVSRWIPIPPPSAELYQPIPPKYDHPNRTEIFTYLVTKEDIT